ncbi:MAG: tetratricopeptide repeat protein [Akkermansiaceae bacterium]|nr:tetratricopeptide repeat protein [Akkermansiaceae bacterium]
MRKKVILPLALNAVSLAVLVSLASCGSKSDDLPLSGETAALGGVDAANTLLNEAKGYEGAGKTSKAISAYGDVAKRYPYSSAAPEARYAEGRLLDQEGDLFKAFEAYQDLIARYPNSKHYAPAIKRQEAVAHAAANGIIKNNFLGMKTRISPEKTEKMLGHVRDNAPRALSAPKAQLAIGRIWQKAGNADKSIAAYQRIGVDYPDSSAAPEALYQTGEILILKAERGNQNKANVNRARDIFQDLIRRYPSHGRAADARKRLALLGGQDIQRSFDTGEFYRKKGQTQSAIFYYREVMRKARSGTLYNQAKQRISELGGQ